MNWPWTAWAHKPPSPEQIEFSEKLDRMNAKTIVRIKEELFRNVSVEQLLLFKEVHIGASTTVVNGQMGISLGGLRYHFASNSSEIYELNIDHEHIEESLFHAKKHFFIFTITTTYSEKWDRHHLLFKARVQIHELSKLVNAIREWAQI